MDKIACPACGQGWILRVRILRMDKEAFVCEECETIWFNREDIGSNERVDTFVGYMEANGLPGLWTELQIIDGP